MAGDWGMQLSGLANILDAFDALQVSFDGDDTVYVAGTDQEYAIHLEFGTSKMPSYPFVRPAVDELKRNPETFVAKNTKTTLWEKAEQGMRPLVKTIALSLEAQITKNATAGRSGDRSPGTDPDHPQRQTGDLAGDISTQRVR